MTITLTGYIEVSADRRAAIRAALPAHIALTRAEPGCLAFSVTEDPTHPGRFTVSERFTNRAAFEAHQRRSQASAWAELSRGIPRHYTMSDSEDPANQG